MFESNAFLGERGCQQCQQAQRDTPPAPTATLEKATSICWSSADTHRPKHTHIPDSSMMDSFQLNLSAKDEHFGESSSNQIRVYILHIMEGSFTGHPLSHQLLLQGARPFSWIFSNSSTFRLKKFSKYISIASETFLSNPGLCVCVAHSVSKVSPSFPATARCDVSPLASWLQTHQGPALPTEGAIGSGQCNTSASPAWDLWEPTLITAPSKMHEATQLH